MAGKRRNDSHELDPVPAAAGCREHFYPLIVVGFFHRSPAAAATSALARTGRMAGAARETAAVTRKHSTANGRKAQDASAARAPIFDIVKIARRFICVPSCS